MGTNADEVERRRAVGFNDSKMSLTADPSADLFRVILEALRVVSES